MMKSASDAQNEMIANAAGGGGLGGGLLGGGGMGGGGGGDARGQPFQGGGGTLGGGGAGSNGGGAPLAPARQNFSAFQGEGQRLGG